MFKSPALVFLDLFRLLSLDLLGNFLQLKLLDQESIFVLTTQCLSEMKWGFSILSLLQHLKTFQKVQLRKELLMQPSDAD